MGRCLVSRTNYTKLAVDTLLPGDADIEAAVIKHTPITEAERDAIPNPVNGMKIYNSDSNVLEGFIGGFWPACQLLNFTNVSTNGGQTVVFSAGNVLATNNGSSIGVDQFLSDQSFINLSGFTSFELTLNNAVEPNANLQMGMRFTTSDEVFKRGIVMAFPIDSVQGTLKEATTSNALESGLTIPLNYSVMMSLNNSTGEITYQDTLGSSGSAGVFASLAGVALKFIIDIRTLNPNGLIDFNYTADNSEFILTPPEPNTNWCASQLCAPLSLSSVDIGGTQTTGIATLSDNSSQITGTNLTPSTGNNTVSFESVGFITSTDVVHIEGKFVSQVGTGNLVGCGYSDNDPFSAFGDTVTAVFAIPSSGLLLDGVSGSPVETSVTMNPNYAFSVDLTSSAGTAAYKDTEGNSGALTVKVGYNNSNRVFVITAANSGDSLNDQAVTNLNAGVTTDLLPTSGAVSPCQAS